MEKVEFTQGILAMESDLHRFAYKLTANREEANDLLQETSLKALDMKTSIYRIQILKDGCTQSCVTSLSITIVRLYAIRRTLIRPILVSPEFTTRFRIRKH